MCSCGCLVLTHSSLIATSSPVEIFVPWKTNDTFTLMDLSLYKKSWRIYNAKTQGSNRCRIKSKLVLAIAAQVCHVGKTSAVFLLILRIRSEVFNHYLGICLQKIRFQSFYQVDTCFQHVVPSLYPPKSKTKPNQNGGLRGFLSAVMKESTDESSYQTLHTDVKLVKIVGRYFPDCGLDGQDLKRHFKWEMVQILEDVKKCPQIPLFFQLVNQR